MNKKEKFALFLGMLSGDGCLPLKHSGQGYRDYAVQFYNTNKKIVDIFSKLFYALFKTKGKIRYDDRNNKKRLFCFYKYSKDIVEKIKKTGFPEGIKRDILKVPSRIKNGTIKERVLFTYGFLITDGCLRKDKTIIFHSGSKLFLEELSKLINHLINSNKKVKEFTQRKKFKSYQLNLNKEETRKLLSRMPSWDNGTPAALSSTKI